MLQHEASRTSISNPSRSCGGRHSARLPARRPLWPMNAERLQLPTSVDLGPFIGIRSLWGRRGRGQDGLRRSQEPGPDPGRIPDAQPRLTSARDGELQFVRSSTRSAGVGACMIDASMGHLWAPRNGNHPTCFAAGVDRPPAWPCATRVDPLVTIYHQSHVTSVLACSCACCWTCREPTSLPHLGTSYQAGHGALYQTYGPRGHFPAQLDKLPAYSMYIHTRQVTEHGLHRFDASSRGAVSACMYLRDKTSQVCCHCPLGSPITIHSG